jgi:hypothetical protein
MPEEHERLIQALFSSHFEVLNTDGRLRLTPGRLTLHKKPKIDLPNANGPMRA